MSFIKGTIEKRVMAVVRSRIEKSEKEHAEHCAKLDSQARADIAAIKVGVTVDKEKHAASMVAALTGSLAEAHA